ncbi:putative membrane protein YdbT with pleckstrin-like domain [Marmoricola sp. OAE513]|uniref:PH domain-containing protein n=1 Tax=Marmoricola sp. OAE513 TaxID=2817894 RepID=UPI001AE8D221
MVKNTLNPGESIVFSTRTHVKALFLPAFILIVVAGAAGYLASLPSSENDNRKAIWIAIAVVAAALIVWFCLRPFLTWLTATYTVTNRRLTTHQGVITRTGHDIQLTRISDVSYEKGLVDRLFGCGTLVISDASDLGVKLPDVPKVAERQRIISDLLYQRDANNDGT